METCIIQAQKFVNVCNKTGRKKEFPEMVGHCLQIVKTGKRGPSDVISFTCTGVWLRIIQRYLEGQLVD